MEEILWFAVGSVAGATLTKWGRQALLGAATTAIVVGDAVAGGATRIAGVVSTGAAEQRKRIVELADHAVETVSKRTAQQRKAIGEFFAEARSKARTPKQAAAAG